MKWVDVVRLGKELPEVEEGIWYRTPALRVRGKSFVGLKEDLQNVVFLLESWQQRAPRKLISALTVRAKSRR